MKKLGLFFTLLLILIIVSCEIGLGSSVDTEAPTISIENPPTDAKIREAFMIDGNWSDDGAISKLSIELKSNDSKISAKHTFEGTLNYEVKSSGGKGTWYALIDPIKEGIKDGTYEASVTIVDSMGHKTSTNRSYTIDNTKPVIKIERPSSIKNAEDSLIESYGQYLTLTGEAYDDNDIATIKITFYDAEEDSGKGPWPTYLTGVSSKIDNDIAKFSKTFDVNNIYSQMYGNDPDGGTHKYYCTIETYDGTKRYPPKGQEKEDDDLGNPTNTYLLDDDLQEFNKENSALCEALKGKDQKFKVKDLYAIKAGNSNFTSDRAVSDEYLSEALEKINELFTNKSVSEGSLKLNPKNNPSFSVSGLELGEITNVENERALTVQLSKGLDGIKIDRDSLKVYLIPVMDPQGNAIENADKIYLSDDDAQYEKKGDGQFLATIRKKQDVNDPEKDLVYRTVYIIGVEGEDIEGNKMEASLDGSNKDYRIRLKAKNIPPELTITKPEDTIWYTKKGDSVVIEGTTSVPDGQPTLELRKNGSKDSIWTYTVSESDLATDSEDDWIKYNFSVTIPDDTTGFAFSEEKTDKYVFEIVSTLEESSSSASKTIVYDIDPPTIQNYSLTSAYDAGLKDGIKTYYIDNRETPFTLTGIAKDNLEVGEVSLTIKDENGTTLEQLTSTDAVWTFESNSETEAWTDNWKSWTNYVTAIISAKDKAGNETIAPKDFRIIFDTEAPVSKHCVDTSGKDLYFRIGEQSNDDIDSTSSLWDESLDKDVGGKYKSGTFGNKETIKIRGNFGDGTGSGVKMIYYKLFTHEPTTTEIQSFLKNYESQAITETGVGYFSPLAVPETKRIFYADKSASGDLNDGTLGNTIVPAKKSDNSPDIQNGKFYTDIVSTYKTMITGFTAGYNHLALVAVDNVGHAAIDSVSSYCINVDTQAPETLSAEDVFTDGSADLKLTFTVNDKPDGQDAVSAGVNKVSVKMESVTETKSATLDTTLGSPTNGKWVVTIPVAELPSTSGSYAVSVTAVDGAGEGNSDTRTVCNVIVDKDPPEISNVKFEEVLTSSSKDVSQKNDYYYVNNTQGKQFRVSGVATDNRGVKSISLDVINTAANSTASLPNQTLTNPAQNWNFTVGDWSSWTTGATLVITATDKAGLTSSQTLNIAFDTVAPTVSTEENAIIVPNPSQTENSMFKFEGAAGSLSDAASGLDKVEIAFTSDNTEPTAAQATVTPSSNGSWSSTVEFANAAFGGVFNTQGTKYLWVKAYDKAGNASVWTPKSFKYDTAAPEVSFTDITPAANSYRKEGFKLEVNASDSYGVDSVTVSYGTETTVPLTLNTETGKYEKSFRVDSEPGDATHLDDGKYTFTVHVTDKSGKSSEAVRAFSIDTILPTGSFAENQAGTLADGKLWFKSSSVRFAVNVIDANIDTVEITKDGSIYDPMTLSSGSYSATLTELSEGENTITVKMKDHAGNENTTSTVIYVDTTEPSLNVNASSVLKYMGSGGFTVDGTVGDSGSGVATLTVTEEYSEDNVNFEATPASGAAVEFTGNNWTKHLPLGASTTPANGYYRYKFILKDKAGNSAEYSTNTTVDIVPPSLSFINPTGRTGVDSINASPYMFSGSINEANEIKAIYYKILDIAADEPLAPTANIIYESTWTNAGWTSVTAEENWSFYRDINNGTNPVVEGKYKIYMYVLDGAGNLSTRASQEFHVDMAAPVVTAEAAEYVNYGTNADHGRKVTISGTVEETHGLLSFIIKRNDETGNGTSVTPASNGSWSYENTPEADGTYTYTIIATDLVGKTNTTLVKTVIVDTEMPTVTAANIIVPTSRQTESEMFKFEGTVGSVADSGSGLDKVEIAFTSENNEPTAAQTIVTPSSNGSWSSAVEFTNSAFSGVFNTQGTKYIWVRAYDKAGNASGWVSKSFVYDTETPTISFTATTENKNPAADSFRNAEFKLEVAAADSYGITSVNVNYGSPATTKSMTQNADGNYEVSFVVGSENADEDNYLADGSYNFEVVVTDSAIKTNKVTRNFSIDTTKPSITQLKLNNAVIAVDTDTSSTWYKTQTIPLFVIPTYTTGDSGIASVEYATLTTSQEANETTLADSNWTPLSSQSTGYSGSAIFSGNGIGQKLYIRIKDKAGNVNYFKQNNAHISINIDTTVPELQTLYYQIGEGSLKTLSGTLYVNGTAAVTLYGSYKDFESGVNPLAFTLGGTALSPTVTYSTGTPATGSTADETAANVAGLTYGSYAAASKKQYTYWKAVYTPTTGGKIGISGSNGTHIEDTNIGTISDSPCTITIDGTAPNLQNIRLIIDEANDKDAYKKTVSNAARYYINNSTNTSLVISGVAIDNIGVEKVELSIPGTGTTAGTSADYSNAGTASEWKFENINLSAVAQNSNNAEPDATATITVTDVAGNTYNSPLSIFFDTTGPIGIHQQDAESNDLYFRLGDDDNDSGSDALNTDVGKMYSEHTYGNASTIKIRGKINDSESGVKLIYYHVFDKPICLDSSVADTVEPTPKTVSEVDYYAFRNEAKLRDYVIAHSTGYFAPLSSAQTKRVYYKVNATTQAYMDVDATYYETLSGFDNSINYLVIAAEDNVGNKGLDTATVAPGYSKINVDNTPPSLTLTLEEGQEAIFYSNKTADLSFEGTATDDLSGIKTITFNVNGHVINTTENDYGKVEITNVTGSTVSKNWSLIVKPAALPNSGTVSVMGTVTDNAGSGNSQTAPACTIIMDTTPPKVTINDLSDADTTADGTQINGVISISGTASDANGLATTPDMILYYTTSETLAAATTAPAAADVIATATSEKTAANSWLKIGTASHNSPWTFGNIDTSTLEIANQATTTVYFMVAAKDSSGNVGYSYQYNSEGEKVARKAYIVDQDSDRPIITVTGPSSLEELSDGAVNWESRTISGTVSDDDNSITYIGYYVGDEISYTATDYTELTIRNGVWKFNLSADGSQKVFFKVTAGGEDYYANTSTTYSNATVYDSENSRGTYKLTDGTNYFGTRPSSGTTTTATSLALVIDTTPPDVETPEYSVDDGATWQTGVGAQTFGGTLRNNIKIRQSGWDKNTVKSMTVKVVEIIDGNDSETPKFSGTYNYNTTAAEALPANTNNRSYTRFTSAAFDTTVWKSSGDNADGHKYAYRVDIVISDGIKETLTKLDLTVDNTLPQVTFSGPKEGIYSGDVTAYGATNEKCKISYTISTDGVNKPSSTAGQTLISWTGYTLNGEQRTATEGTIANVAVPAYSVIPNADLAWTINFDDNTNDTEHAHSAKLKDYVKNLGIIGATENLSSFTKLVNFYLWIKVEDVVGNTEEYSHLICVDPNGDKPTVSITNPEEPNVTNGAASLGGTIKLSGTAEDSNGSVESVWVQLLSANNGTGYGDVSVTNNTITNFEPTTKDLDFWKTQGYTVAKMKPETDGTHTAWTGTTTSPGTLPSGETVSDYGIQATFSGTSWNLKINSAGEFNPTGNSVNDMAVRVYACDNEKNLSYSVTRYFKIDKNTPVISDVVLRQYAASDTDFASPLASQDVRSGMYVKGNWYLEFTVTDDAGIESIEFDGITDPQKQIGASNISGTTASKKVRFAISSATGNEFKRTIKASDNSTPSNTGTYDIEIYFDNDAPKLLRDTAGDFDIAASVHQSNGFYKLYSKVNDESGSSKGSGIKAVGFYFMRRKAADEGLIYDPMQQRVAPISTKASNVTYADGLYWLNGKVNCSSDGSITLADGLSEKAAYVHAGSYIRLAGVMYKITSKSGTTVMIEEDHATGNDISAQIALALFVDNRKAEYEAASTKDTITGYYTSIKNTDGDSMIEELGGTETVSSWQGSIVSRNIPDGPIEIHYTAYDKSMNYAVGVVGNKSLDIYKNYTTKEVNELWTMNGTERVSLKEQVNDGQYASYVYTYNEENPAYISNNAPRLTGVTVAIDYTGSGEFETAMQTATTYYFKEDFIRIDANGTMEKKPVSITKDYEISQKIKTGEQITGYEAINTIKGKTWIIPEMVGGNNRLWYSYNVYNSNENGSKNTDSIKKQGDATATYFADGRDNYDQYEGELYGSTYVVSHSSSKKIGDERVPSYIVHDESFFTGQNGTGDASVTQPLWFDYTIYDSTEFSSDEDSVAVTNLANNQKATISIAMAVEVNDNLAPNVVFNDLYWKNKSDNSVYWADGKAQGHVELRSDLVNIAGTANCELGTTYGTDDDKVSGIVKFTGYAWDNKCLSELKWAIVENEDDDDDEETVAYSDPAYKFGEGMQNGATFDTSTGNWTSSATLADDYYTFEVSKLASDGAYHDKNGHKVKWTLTVDTAHIAHEYEEGKFAPVAENLRVIVQATDNASTVHSSEITNTVVTSTTTDIATYDKNTSRPTYQVDVVPYITGVKTKLSSLKKNNPSVYDRTALGHYPVSDTETVTFSGFNLAGAQYQKVAPKPAEGDNPAVEEVVDDLTGENVNELAVSNILASGKIVLRVGNLYTINNMNNNDAKGRYSETVDLTTNPAGDKSVYENYYNRMPNGDNNNLLTDDVEFDVWQINSEAGKPKAGPLSQPVMAINPKNKQVGFAFANGPLHFSMGSPDKSYDVWEQGLDFWTSIGFAYDANGNSFGTTAGGDINGTPKADSFGLFTSRWAGKGIYDNGSGHNNGTGQLRLENLGQSESSNQGDNWNGNNINKQRIKSPSIATSVASENADSTIVYLAYYDEINDEIRFKWGIISDSDNNTAGRSKNNLLYDYYGGESPNDDKYKDNGRNTVSLTGLKDVVKLPYTLEYVSLIAGQTKDKWSFIPGKNSNNKDDANRKKSKYQATTAVTTVNGQPVYAGQYVSIAVKQGAGEAYSREIEVSELELNEDETPKKDPYGCTQKKTVKKTITTNDDLVVAVWYDATHNQMLYSYNKKPQNIKAPTYKDDNKYIKNSDGTSSGIDSFSQSATGWSSPVAIFGEGNGIGEYCKVAIDGAGKVHIACYDNANADVWYAYLDNYANPDAAKTCIVDSYGIVGTELNIDVALKDNKPVPYISYYGSSCARPKVAYWAGDESIATASNLDGAKDEAFTKSWEVSIIPSSSKISIDHINVGVWKDTSGNLTYSTTDGNAPNNIEPGEEDANRGVSEAGNEEGMIYGNGTKNPILGYAITKAASGFIETAQMK